ncbi:MAG: penicillin-binding protein activator [Porticoccus sp.]|nr:penicillin-binding protein activator [Porticoccus sp.]
MFKIRITITTLCLLTLLIAGCKHQPRSPVVENPPRQTIAEQADRELSLAASSISPQRELHQLQAVELLIQTHQNEKALVILETIAAVNLPNQDFAKYNLMYADLALANDHFFMARQLLSSFRIEQQWQQLSLTQQQHWHQLRGELFSLLGEDKKSIAAYVALSKTSTFPEQRQETHEKIWLVLTHIPHDKMEELKANEQDLDILGWYFLASITRKNQGDVRQQLDQIEEWRRNWPNHPASLTPPSIFSSIQNTANNVPKRIAMLLPLHGRLAQAGKAIRSGFLATLYEIHKRSGETPRVRFYDTAAVDNITKLYQQAVSEGAQLVIGPVQKSKVRQLLSLPEIPVPTIALNYLEDTTTSLPKNFFQFGLSATDEARQIADRAWIEGQRSALTITPNSSWGDRTLTAFRERWLEKGGILVESTPYDTSQRDFAPLLKPALHIDQSKTRKKRLQQLLGKSLNHTLRRRQDIDMVFMAAYPDHARQIKPTLDFLFARDLQIYGTSHLYTGVENLGRNRDLEGIRFSAMPWTLPGATDEKLQPATTLPPLYRHIFALGIDAYNLHQWLEQMVLQPSTQIFGSTGTLQLNAMGAIEREQPWAVFRAGKVRSAQQLIAN